MPLYEGFFVEFFPNSHRGPLWAGSSPVSSSPQMQAVKCLLGLGPGELYYMCCNKCPQTRWLKATKMWGAWLTEWVEQLLISEFEVQAPIGCRN